MRSPTRCADNSHTVPRGRTEPRLREIGAHELPRHQEFHARPEHHLFYAQRTHNDRSPSREQQSRPKDGIVGCGGAQPPTVDTGHGRLLSRRLRGRNRRSHHSTVPICPRASDIALSRRQRGFKSRRVRDALIATDQIEHAQRLRWAAFEDRLSEDVLAEERAMEHAHRFRNFPIALHFFHE